MLLYDHQLVANCVYLLVGAKQVVYSGFMQLPATAEYEVIQTEKNQNN